MSLDPAVEAFIEEWREVDMCPLGPEKERKRRERDQLIRKVLDARGAVTTDAQSFLPVFQGDFLAWRAAQRKREGGIQ